MSEERFATAAPLPARLHRLHELALDLWWSWDDRARPVFRQLDYSLWRATAHNPVQMLQRITAERLSAAAADPNFLKAYDEAIFGLDQARTVAHPWWREQAVDARQRQHRLLLRRVRAASVAADLCGRPRRARRRSLQGSRGPRPAVRRHRLHVSAGLLPPAHDQRRLAGRALRAHQLDRRADRSRDHARWPARASPPCRWAIARCWRRCGACGSAACGCSCSTPTSPRTRRGIASCRRASTAAIAKRASSRKSSSASAACARCARSASRRRCGTSTKATPRSSRCSASAR